jgi:hypothetical protein
MGLLGEALNNTGAAVGRLESLLPDTASFEIVRNYILPSMKVE